MDTYKYLVLYRDGRRVRAADATSILEDGEFPRSIRRADGEYCRIDNQETFFFWDELRDAFDRTVGYEFLLADNEDFAASRLLTESDNVANNGSEVRILLQDCPAPNYECIQGFGSEVYQNITDPRDCMLLMFDWSQNPFAFDLPSEVVTRFAQ